MKPAFLGAAMMLGWLGLVRADEPRTFYGKTVEAWSAVLRAKQSSLNERRKAVVALAGFGPYGKSAVPDLIAALRDKELKDAALDALSWIGTGTEHAVPLLIEQLVLDGPVRFNRERNLSHYLFVRDALARIGEPAVPALIELLDSQSPELRASAADTIACIGPPARAAVRSLIRAIEQPAAIGETAQRHSLRALGRIGPDAAAAAPALRRWLADIEGLDYEVVEALDKIGDPPIQKLTDALLHRDFEALRILTSIGPRARAAVPALRKALAVGERPVRFECAEALAFIDPTTAEAIPVLIEALDHVHDEDVDVCGVPMALAHLGTRAIAAIPKLAELVRKGCEDPLVAEALAQIDSDGKESVPALICALDYENQDVVAIAADCLGLLGTRAKSAVPALARVVAREFSENDASDRFPQRSAVVALRRIGPDSKASVPVLIRVLTGERSTPSLRAAAADTLGALGADAKSAVPALVGLVQGPTTDSSIAFIRGQAILALGKIGPEADVSVSVIRKLLDQDEKLGRSTSRAIVALVQLDSEGEKIADRWLEKQAEIDRVEQGAFVGLASRAVVLGALGRTVVETDCQTRRYLMQLESQLDRFEPADWGSTSFTQTWFSIIAQLGPAARIAIPRLTELRAHHPSPFVRLWAREVLDKITAPARTATAPTPSRLDQAR
jgi:HEAT repeat protein